MCNTHVTPCCWMGRDAASGNGVGTRGFSLFQQPGWVPIAVKGVQRLLGSHTTAGGWGLKQGVGGCGHNRRWLSRRLRWRYNGLGLKALNNGLQPLHRRKSRGFCRFCWQGR